jgi:hypothetical protein
LSVKLSVTHYTSLTLIANVDHHAQNLVGQVKETSPFDYMLSFELEGSWIFIKFKRAGVACLVRALPSNLARKRLYEF